jgi:pimeloyl-ACP methyl ester carboxylesterase
VTNPAYVLVHGAWGGAWCWDEVTTHLNHRGITWRAVDLPSSELDGDPDSDLAADAAVVIETAKALNCPVVLVGHSYGGAVITEAAPQVPKLSGLFYIAATVPDVGQSHSDTMRLVKVRTEMDDAIHVDGAIVRLDVDVAAAALYQECTPELRDWAKSLLSTQTLASFRGKRTATSVKVTSRYLRCRHDHALDPSLQELVSKRCDEVVEIESDHSPFLSHSGQLVDILTG